MAEQQIRFEDGAAYERWMGAWSRLAGTVFLDWLAPPAERRWLDVGCGSGAFSQLVTDRCAPAELHGIDPSEAQLAFARSRPAARVAQFRQGDATALPFPDRRFDVAVMALVIFFVPEPEKGVAEMMRVVDPGGVVAAYAWDMPGGGFPGEPIHTEMRAMGVRYPRPPSYQISAFDALRGLWRSAGLDMVEAHEITVERTFAGFDDFWTTALASGNIGPIVRALPPGDGDRLKTRVQASLPADAAGQITYSARANAVKGRVPE